MYKRQTYKSSDAPAEIKVPKLALNPEYGGPENLPILRETLDAYDSEMKELTSYKPKLVVLGSGWASVGLLKNLKPGDYDVTVVSPQNYFLFTPLLPSAATGTLEVKSLMASIRKIVNDVDGHYLEAVSYTHLDVYKRQEREREAMHWLPIAWACVHSSYNRTFPIASAV